MRALTLHPEWICPILSDHRAAKRAENRSWALPDHEVGTAIALHSGVRFGGSAGWCLRDPVEQRRRRGPFGAAVPTSAWVRCTEAILAVGTTAEAAGLPWRSLLAAHARQDDDPRLQLVHAMTRWASPGHVVAVVRFSGCDLEQRTPWDVRGQYHWRISDVIWLPAPIRCVGRQQLWYLPDDVHAEVLRQVTGRGPREAR